MADTATILRSLHADLERQAHALNGDAAARGERRGIGRALQAIGAAIDEVDGDADEARQWNQRMQDMVRHCRADLHRDGLLDEVEYAALCADPGAVARLEDYDGVRREREQLRAQASEAIGLLEVAGHRNDTSLRDRCAVCFDRWPCDVEEARRALSGDADA